MPNVDYTTVGTYQFQVPFAVNEVTVTAIGGGSSGFDDNDGDSLGEGGGGGACIVSRHPVTVGDNLFVTVGAGGAYANDSIRPGGLSRVLGGTVGNQWEAVGGGGRNTSGGLVSNTGPVNAVILSLNGQSGRSRRGNIPISEMISYRNNVYTPLGLRYPNNCLVTNNIGEEVLIALSLARSGGQGGGAGGATGCSIYMVPRCCSGSRIYSTGGPGRGRALDGSPAACTTTRQFNGASWGGGGGGNGPGGNCSGRDPAGTSSGAGSQGAVRIAYNFATPELSSVNGAIQTSSNGTPQNNVTLSWTTQYTETVEIYDGATLLFTGGANASATVPTGLQSEAGVNSPAQKILTFRLINGGGGTDFPVTVSVFNDNTPSSVNRLSEGMPFNADINELEPNTFYYITHSISGVDMPTSVVANNNCTISLNATNYGPSRLVPIGNEFYVGFTSEDFNQSRTPSGFDGNGRAIGQPNPKTLTFTVGTQVVNLNVATRGPVIQELFDAEGQPLSPEAYPNPDIDTIFPNVNTTYVTTNSITTNDAEIAVEVKASLPDVEVRVNGTVWENVREIGT